ncbi:MAG: SHOCT-like domain-containing protein [Candidatus Acidiferrales bacterium]
MSAETKKVLELLAAGKISPEDAERLLDKLTGAASSPEPSSSQTPGATTNPAGACGSRRPRFIRVQVERPGREGVNVRVPLSCARGGRHWMAFLPTRVAEKLQEHGIDFGSLDAMNDEDFQKAMERINVDIEGRSGRKVRIFAE